MKKGIHKTIEMVTAAGIMAGGIAGMVVAGKVGSNAEKDVSNMLSSPEVNEYIQDDLSVLNNKFNEGSVDYDAYRQQVNTLKENAAKEVFGEKYETAKKDSNKGLFMIVPFPFVPVAGGVLLSDVIFNKGDESFLSEFSAALAERKRIKDEEKRIKEIQKALKEKKEKESKEEPKETETTDIKSTEIEKA